MSLVSTLGKIAVGMLINKGISKMTGGSSSSGGLLGGLLGSLAGGSSQSSGGIGDILGSLMGGGSSQRSSSGGLGDILGSLAGGGSQRGGGGLDDILGSLMGGNNSQSSSGMGGLGSLIGALAGGSQQSNNGGLGDIIGMLAGKGQQGGGLGGLLDSLAGDSQSNSGFGNVLNSALQGKQGLVTTPDQEKQAEIMLRAIVSAAKADGDIDAEEQKKISEHLDDVSPEELELLRSIMQEPNDINALINSVPAGMEQQVYFMSLLAIDLDSQAEAQYLDKLAKGLNISPEVVNQIHEKAGAPALYS